MAALRALAIEGIQKGHMGLHARNIAVQAGVPPALVTEVVDFMKRRGRIAIDTAKQYMEAHQIYQLNQDERNSNETPSPNYGSLFIEIDEPLLQEKIIFNILLDLPKTHKPIHITIDKTSKESSL